MQTYFCSVEKDILNEEMSEACTSEALHIADYSRYDNIMQVCPTKIT